MGKFIAGVLATIFLVSVVNCSGNKVKPSGTEMEIINHTPTVEVQQPCKQ